jgi:hypothetical protein
VEEACAGAAVAEASAGALDPDERAVLALLQGV